MYFQTFFVLEGIKQRFPGIYNDRTSYRLRVPPNPPMKQFWSITMYDQAKRTLIKNGTDHTDRSSRDELVKNADGPVDLYFGPHKAPKGMENNFIKTNSGDGFFFWFRLYTPTEPYLDQS